MANAKLYNYYTELPSWAKGLVVVGGMAIAYIIGNKIYIALKPKPQDIKNIEDDIAKLSKEIKATYNAATYDQYANIIYNAQRVSLGNDSGTITDIALMMKNDLDVAKLVKAYGTRQDYAFGFPTDSFGLFGAMRKGIESAAFGAFSYRIGKINKDWESKGITYRI
jgi:hypothetical protein